MLYKNVVHLLVGNIHLNSRKIRIITRTIMNKRGQDLSTLTA